ncbi:MAG: PilZ domain-containing protein [Paenibacillus macerans]|uniref:Glycosyl transferase n=1 Tax=Paenibacillus macerans TaxID=44252 RepID=A0A090ZH43_PAEMA|nr:PilZ domain-containing protein [Paenibacillus macerans]KFN09545.1 pilZ domain protein [Paenibacillus macerans]MBS5909469.1 PilZ domain-containing protein [Paenibacillus macerans]MCY7561647.1 PilZ domain-containing protein [Paenibacillus macerans]MDU7474841.1 PilZ domain-containing protein [Paenibacillus macerans]MEC0137160.1 PilZ domain-containing protein [Paenibacillus macerans]
MFPKVNDLVYIQVASTDKQDTDKECKSRIADVEEESFLIEVPIESGSGRIKKLYIGDELSIYFLTDDGVKNYFNTYVLGFADEVVQLVRIRKPEAETITKIQRRHFLRVVASLEIAVKTKNNLRFVTYTEDVSGGGVSFICDGTYKLVQGDQLFCWLLLSFKNGSIDHVPFEAEVVRTKKLETGKAMIMIKFVSISDMERQKLIRYCFERQFDFKNR